MQIDKKAIQDRLRKFDFTGIFTQELGWDFPPGNLDLTVAGKPLHLQAVAEKRGLVAFVCSAKPGERLPDYATRRKIEREVAKHRHQHLVVFTDAGKSTQVWQWVKRELGKPAACREQPYHVSQPGEALIQKLTALAVSLQEEEGLTHVDVTGKVKKAFDVEKVTKRFYDRFQKEHQAFAKLLKGIPDEDLARWYISVMLNRLMFIYFVQSKGFLGDADRDYLRTKLVESKLRGRDRYYREFLCPLFFEGFAKRPHERSAAMNALLGTVPYLNGGLFLKHQIEELHGEAIRIPDAAFENLFDFFHGYHWHLDERPLKADNEINPDDATAKKCKDDFAADAPVWRLLRYNLGEADLRFPSPAGRGAGGEGRDASEKLTLPTETWREYVVRRQRCLELREKLRNGEVASINDLITLNLDIRQFAQDAIANCQSPELLAAFFDAICTVTVLDPTCGSGAFLFAALNILEPLYEACLDRMESFLAAEDTKAAVKGSGNGNNLPSPARGRGAGGEGGRAVPQAGRPGRSRPQQAEPWRRAAA